MFLALSIAAEGLSNCAPDLDHGLMALFSDSALSDLFLRHLLLPGDSSACDRASSGLIY